MARSTLSFGMFAPLAARIAVRRRGLEVGSPPPMRAAMLISRMMRVNTRPRFASVAPFLCLIVAHFECPDITHPLVMLDRHSVYIGNFTPARSGSAASTESGRAVRRPTGEPRENPAELLKFNTAPRPAKRTAKPGILPPGHLHCIHRIRTISCAGADVAPRTAGRDAVKLRDRNERPPPARAGAGRAP